MASAQRLTGIEKAAIIAITIGSENAAKVFRNLREDEIEQLTYKIAQMGNVNPETVTKVVEDFYELCMAQKFISEGGLEYARSILEKAFGQKNAESIIGRIAGSMQVRSFDFIRKIDPQYLLTFIQNEYPQTIALILSYARPEQASQILSELPKDIQVEVAERIATLDRASPEVIKDVEKTLEKKLSSIINTDYTQAGGVENVAEILNNVDRTTEKNILDTLAERDPQLAEEIRKRMFVFEDIITLDSLAIQRVLRGTDSRDIMIALKGATKAVQDIIYANLPERMREAIQEEMKYLRGVRYKDVEEAQQRIVSYIRKLEEDGEIVVKHSGKDEFVD